MSFKMQNNCQNCLQLNDNPIIHSPNHLTEIIEIIQDLIIHKKIIELKNSKSIIEKHNRNFEIISCNGPWEDVISYTFKCLNCKNYFHLFVETYHGSGGELRRLGQKLKYNKFGNVIQ